MSRCGFLVGQVKGLRIIFRGEGDDLFPAHGERPEMDGVADSNILEKDGFAHDRAP
jgi:hypothetical protein